MSWCFIYQVFADIYNTIITWFEKRSYRFGFQNYELLKWVSGVNYLHVFYKNNMFERLQFGVSVCNFNGCDLWASQDKTWSVLCPKLWTRSLKACQNCRWGKQICLAAKPEYYTNHIIFDLVIVFHIFTSSNFNFDMKFV